jgi:hypothetical protein
VACRDGRMNLVLNSAGIRASGDLPGETSKAYPRSERLGELGAGFWPPLRAGHGGWATASPGWRHPPTPERVPGSPCETQPRCTTHPSGGCASGTRDVSRASPTATRCLNRLPLPSRGRRRDAVARAVEQPRNLECLAGRHPGNDHGRPQGGGRPSQCVRVSSAC